MGLRLSRREVGAAGYWLALSAMARRRLAARAPLRGAGVCGCARDPRRNSWACSYCGRRPVVAAAGWSGRLVTAIVFR